MESILIRILQLIMSLSILVIIHEFGHFIFAKIFGVRVEKFYLFFDPWFAILKFKPKNSETEYGIGWLPVGGYVKLAGMIDESMDKEQMAKPSQIWEFRSKPAGQRLLIMIGGVMMNFVLAFFIYAMILFHWGEESLPLKNIKMGLAYNTKTVEAGFRKGDIPLSADGKALYEMDGKTQAAIIEAKTIEVLRNGKRIKIVLPKNFNKIVFEKEANFIVRFPLVIEKIVHGSPAQKAGLMQGDSLVGIASDKTMSFDDLAALWNKNKEKKIEEVYFYRHNKLMKVSLIPDKNGKIGVYTKSPLKIYPTIKTRYGFFSSFPSGAKMGVEIMRNYLSQFKYLFTKQGAESLGGFGTIASIFPPTWDWFSFWTMTAFLSIILGIMNILPIPALDGGHVMFLLFEVISGRKPSDKFMEYAQTAGMIFLLALLIYANGNDIVRFLFNK